jgi:Ca-activated chloride channel family protein
MMGYALPGLTFLRPVLLWALVLVPLLVFLYVWLMRRSLPRPIGYPNALALDSAAHRSSAVRRHLPAACFAVSLTSILLAAAGPMLPLLVPAERSAIMLSIDVSGSMRSQDMLPSRLEAAKAAAKAFVETLPDRVRVGLVMFGGYAIMLVPPMTDHDRVASTIESLSPIRRTAIGEGLLEAVVALPGRVRPESDRAVASTIPSGTLPSGIVILLSDGNSNTGIDPLEAAEIARAQQVTVYTIGVGQPRSGGAWTLGGPLDEETLQTIAQRTGGRYYHASSAERLHRVYRTLARSVGWERRPQDASSLAAALALVALAGALAALAATRPLL